MSRSGRLGVGVIGAGKVGPVLAAALAGAGHALTGITSGSDDEHVDVLLPGVPRLEPAEVVERSELVIIAVPSAELEGLVAGLAALAAWQPGQLVLHTAPEFGTEILRPAVALGVIPLAVHPAVSFSGTSMDLMLLQGSFAGVTAPAAVLPIAQALAVELGCGPVVILEADRPAYAEAIATATTFSRAIVQQATGLLAGIGVESPGSFLSALVRSAVDQALTETARSESDPDPR